MSFKEIDITTLNENFLKNIGTEWMLITAGNKQKHNMMTASWGFMGIMWGVPCAVAAVRPQRFTKQFMDNEDYYTLSFYGDRKDIHKICGSQSGRDIDKTAATGLTPLFDETTGAPYFAEARLVLVVKKLYQQPLNPENFSAAGKDLIEQNYAANDFHEMYYGQIVKALIAKA